MSERRFRPRDYVGCILLLLLTGFLPLLARCEENPLTVNVQVHADQPDGTIAPIWNYFGYD